MAYTPLRISTVKPERELTFDLYIFFKDTYLKYQDSGTSIEKEKYTKLKAQKVAKFYITEEDEPNYQKFLDKLLNDTMEDPNISVDEKVNMVDGACSTAIEKMQEQPESEMAYKMTNTAAKNLRQIVEKNPEALKKIFGKKVDDADLVIKHSLNVSALATKLASKLGLKSEEIDNIAVAGLIHDVGMTRLNKEDQMLFKKDRSKFTPDDKRIYGLHVKDAITVLKNKPWVNTDVIEIAMNHEETLKGDGPNKKSKLTKSEMIISLVNRYDKEIVSTGCTPKEAMKNMMIDQVGSFDLDLINKFKEVLISEGLLE